MAVYNIILKRRSARLYRNHRWYTRSGLPAGDILLYGASDRGLPLTRVSPKYTLSAVPLFVCFAKRRVNRARAVSRRTFRKPTRKARVITSSYQHGSDGFFDRNFSFDRDLPRSNLFSVSMSHVALFLSLFTWRVWNTPKRCNARSVTRPDGRRRLVNYTTRRAGTRPKRKAKLIRQRDGRYKRLEEEATACSLGRFRRRSREVFVLIHTRALHVQGTRAVSTRPRSGVS